MTQRKSQLTTFIERASAGFNAEQREALATWQTRVEAGNLEVPGLNGSVEISVMGKSGDTPFALPCIAPDTDRATLPRDVQVALEFGEILVRTFQAAGRSVFFMPDGATDGAGQAAPGGMALGNLVGEFNPTQKGRWMVLAPMAGG